MKESGGQGQCKAKHPLCDFLSEAMSQMKTMHLVGPHYQDAVTGSAIKLAVINESPVCIKHVCQLCFSCK